MALLLVVGVLTWWLALDGRRAPAEPSAPQPPAADPARPTPTPTRQPPAAATTPQPAATATAQPTAAQPPPPAAADEEAARRPQAPDTRGFTTALQSIYIGGTRDAAASDYETALQNMFRAQDMPDGILQAVSCRDTACKLDLRWTLEHDAAYHRVVDRLQADNAKFFATYASPPDATGGVEVTAYWRRSLSLDELRLPAP